MSLALLASRRLVQVVSRTPAIIQIRHGAYWNQDWRPSTKIPKTPEERAAAAKKYGLIPEDYEPYPDDGFGQGDYPKLPVVSADHRDPNALYDMPGLKRNYGEPMHLDFDNQVTERVNYNERIPLGLSLGKMFVIYCSVMLGFWILTLIGEEFRFNPSPKMPKPNLNNYNGEKKYYSFEFVNE